MLCCSLATSLGPQIGNSLADSHVVMVCFWVSLKMSGFEELPHLVGPWHRQFMMALVSWENAPSPMSRSKVNTSAHTCRSRQSGISPSNLSTINASSGISRLCAITKVMEHAHNSTSTTECMASKSLVQLREQLTTS